MGKSQRDKGKAGEREWVNVLKSHGYDAERTQQHKGRKDAFDVVGSDPVHLWEVKRVERLSLPPVVDQARAEAEGDICGVAWRKNGGRWIVAMDADDFFDLIRPLSFKEP